MTPIPTVDGQIFATSSFFVGVHTSPTEPTLRKSGVKVALRLVIAINRVTQRAARQASEG